MEAIEKLGLTAVDGAVIEAIGNFIADSIAAEANWIKTERESLVVQNLLFEDVDLEESGTNWDDDSMDPSGGGRNQGRTGGGRGGDMGDDPGLGDGLGSLAGGRGGDGSRFGSGRGGAPAPGRGSSAPSTGGSLDGESSDQKFVELPNYMLNLSRRRIKSVAFIGKQVMKPAEQGRGLHRVASPENQAKIDRMIAPLDKLLKDSNVGIINLNARKPRSNQVLDDEEVAKKSITDQMIEACETAAKSLQAIFRPIEKQTES
jgi:hypothetical protein